MHHSGMRGLSLGALLLAGCSGSSTTFVVEQGPTSDAGAAAAHDDGSTYPVMMSSPGEQDAGPDAVTEPPKAAGDDASPEDAADEPAPATEAAPPPACVPWSKPVACPDPDVTCGMMQPDGCGGMVQCDPCEPVCDLGSCNACPKPYGDACCTGYRGVCGCMLVGTCMASGS